MEKLIAALAGPFEAMSRYNQFIVYKLIPLPNGKTKKLVIDPFTMEGISPVDPENWRGCNDCVHLASALGPQYGVGFVFTKDDPFFFLDVDGDLNDDGTWGLTSQRMCAAFPGAAVELSQSGKGLHIFGRAAAMEHSCRNDVLGLELYTDSRFVALTGNMATGDASLDLTAALSGIISSDFAPKEYNRDDTWRDTAVDTWSGPICDDELLSRALKSSSASADFGSRANFAHLFNADEAALTKFFPDFTGNNPWNGSAADASLAQHLAFWTGCNHERIKSLMLRSALVRDKWELRETYLEDTILNACNLQGDVYNSPKDKPVVTEAAVSTALASNIEVLTGYQLMDLEKQLEHFKGCVYIRDLSRILVPDGTLLKVDQFKATYGGYDFVMDDARKKTSKNAWEVFTESQLARFPKAKSVCFDPLLPPGAIVDIEGYTFANKYVPLNIRSIEGDITPFLTQLRKVLPIERDRLIFLSYMAACVQHIGHKFQWAPVLQGVEGNGKTLFSRCVAKAVGRRYTHIPKAENIASNFNAWMMDKVFISVEDIYVPDSKNEVMEALKPMITSSEQEIELKGVDQITLQVCANFMFNSNHKDALRKTQNDRRFCVLYAAQQEYKDLERDGMTGDYFIDLYKWLDSKDGYAIVTNYLQNFKIPNEFNPAGGCPRAPATSATEEAISLGRGVVEDLITEVIEQDRPGFRGGWVSSVALDQLLKDERKKISYNKRIEIMKSLGYAYHPGLKKGRVNNPVLPDNGKPKLFVCGANPTIHMTCASEIARAYQDAQTDGGL